MKHLIFLMALTFGLQAHAVSPEEILNPTKPAISFGWLKNIGLDLATNSDYQIGEEWGKRPVTDEDLAENDFFRRMANATAKVRGGGTGFYIGEFNGRYVVATNHHVCPTESACAAKGAIDFPLMKFRTEIVEFYGTWPEIDLSLFSIKVATPELAALLNSYASPFAFSENLYRGQKLVTIGFGIANNPARVMVANRDTDCVVFSGDAEYRLLADPDDFNPASYKAWSFANGCDVSHGDSGSAMMDRETGRVIGIIWTGRIPKNPKVQSSDFLRGLLANPTEEIWKELSYGVPAVQMKAYLEAQLKKGAFSEPAATTLRAILQ